MALHENLIAGEWMAGADVAVNINPSNTGEVVGEYARAAADAVDAAVAAAVAAQPGWAHPYDLMPRAFAQ